MALMIIGYFIVGFFTRRLYLSSILKEMYNVKIDRSESPTPV
jgi:hypothetical protein